MYNKIIVVGKLGKDPEVKTGSKGNFTVFSLATDSYAGKDDTGKGKYNTTWFDVTTFRQTGEFIAGHAKKGDTLLVEGKISTRVYEGKAYLQITADAAQLISRSAQNQGQAQTASAGATASAMATPDEDIPF
jgi:single-strand DNA-binding protein